MRTSGIEARHEADQEVNFILHGLLQRFALMVSMSSNGKSNVPTVTRSCSRTSVANASQALTSREENVRGRKRPPRLGSMQTMSKPPAVVDSRSFV